MSLLNHLRPKWQHSDPDVRAEAVAETDKSQEELLDAVAREDPDPRVRRIAIKKIDRPRVLLELAERDADGSVSDFARERARTLLVRIASDDRDVGESKRALELLSEASDIVTVADKAKFDAVRGAAFERLDDDDALAELVRQSRDAELRLEALERIASPSALKSVIVDESSGDLASIALAKLTDLPTLEAIVSQHWLNKAIRRNAQSRLSALAPADHPVKVEERTRRFEALCEQAESLKHDTDAPSAADALEKAWQAVAEEGAPEDALAQRFEATLVGIREEAARREAARERRAKEASETEDAPAAETTESTEPPSASDASLVSRLTSLEGEALGEAIEDARTERGETTDDELESALTAAEARLETWKKAESIVKRAEAASAIEELEKASEAFDGLVEEWKSVAEDASDDLTGRWRKARSAVSKRASEARKAHEAARQQKTLEELEQRIERLLALAAQDEVPLKDSERELKEAQEFLKSMGPLPPSANRKKLRRKLADARQSLFSKTQETRDNEEWKRWANSDIQESLIAKVEALRESKDIPKIAKQLRLIHDEWKRAGAAVPAKAEALWTRYKAARDELKARCDTYFEEQDKRRGENLEKKLVLCERVEALKDSTDWKETAEAIKALQTEWKQLGPVPNEKSDEIWKRFRAACDHFFSRRNEDLARLKSERTANLKQKQALCERAEAIQASTDWNRTANELKALQAEWKTIGPVPRNKSEAIWQRFRAACDFFFDRNKRRDEVEDEERAKSRLSLVEELEGLDTADAEAVEKTKDLWARWKRLGVAAESESEAVARFEAALVTAVASAPDAFEGSELAPAQCEHRRRKLVEQLEGLVNKEDEASSTGDGLEDLAARLKDALASNTMTGGKGRDPERERRASAAEAHRLRVSWLRAAPVGGEAGQRLKERFDAAYASFQQQSSRDASA